MQSLFPTNPEQYFEQMQENVQHFMKEMLHLSHPFASYSNLDVNWQEGLNISHIFQKWIGEINEKQWLELSYQLMFGYMELARQTQSMLLGQAVDPIEEPAETDRRFKSPAWKKNPFFYFFQQSYLLFVKQCLEFVEKNPSRDPKIAKQVSFFTRQCLDALAPSNFICTNPDILQETIASAGKNLLKGYENLVDDMSRGRGMLNIKMTDLSAFAVGENVAITKGKVVFQNRLIQLIQYEPTTKKVFQRPLLIVPPCINKYYILDLREHNSFVKWLVDQGFTVFIISWVNPDGNYRNVSFEDYVFEGVLAALNAIQQETQEEQINTIGFCIGGTILSATLAYMQEKNDHRIASATFLATLIDFFDPGEIEAFIDDEQLQNLEKKMDLLGYLDGRFLMTAFNLLRANELFWPYYINNYLKGETPPAFDLLYWNSDSTNLPAKMATDYLRQLYLENRLAQPGAFHLGGIPLEINKIETPAYFLSTELDHIAPWQTTFMGARNFQGPLTFVLGGSGHIAGVINPPNNNKYGYRCNDMDIRKAPSPGDWFEKAIHHSGSWWQHWRNWINAYAGEQCQARSPGERLKIIQDAPGDYVKKRLV